jgi:hypothetical protein
MFEFLSWMDGAPEIYWLLLSPFCLFTVCLLFLESPGPQAKNKKYAFIRHDSTFLISLTATLVAIRWPSLVLNQSLSADEAHGMTMAMQFLRDWMPWRAADGVTAGPLFAYPLLLLLWIGFPTNFVTLHCANFFLVILISLFSFWTLRRLFDSTVARWGVLPLLLFFACTWTGSFIEFSTEITPSFLMTAGTYFLVRAGQDKKNIWWTLAGVCIAAAPFAKIQAVPTALVLGGAALYWLAFGIKTSRMRPFLFFAGGLLIPVAFLLGPVWAAGLWSDFWFSYIQIGSKYQHSIKIPGLITIFATYYDEILPYTLSCLLPILVLPFCLRRSSIHKTFWIATFFLAAYLGAGLFEIWRPGSAYAHYFWFLLHPLILIHGFALAFLIRSPKSIARYFQGSRLALRILKLSFLGLCLLFASRPPGPKVLLGQSAPFWQPEQSPVAKEISRYASAGEKVGIWGWYPSFWIETQTIPATRDGHGMFVAFEGRVSPYHRERYLKDFKQELPKVFVDTVAPGAAAFSGPWRGLKHEDFSEFSKLIENNYTQVATLVMTQEARSSADGVRIYVRNEPTGLSK